MTQASQNLLPRFLALLVEDYVTELYKHYSLCKIPLYKNKNKNKNESLLTSNKGENTLKTYGYINT